MIYFIGAGSGAPDLITVRGARLLEQAGCVIYAGSLVNPELLKLCPPECEIHDSARMTLEEVIEVLLAAERAGKLTVRLHTGDPCVYGAIREQMERLDEAGVSYKVVPGVSSFCGAASALPAEYTVPGVSQTVILTRMAGRTPVPKGQELSSLASHRASMVLFLSAGLLEESQAELLRGGYSPDTPAAIVYKATWPDEKVFRCTVSTLAETAKQNGIGKTALILIGDFLGDGGERSLLYDPTFTTGYREAAKS